MIEEAIGPDEAVTGTGLRRCRGGGDGVICQHRHLNGQA